MRVQPGTLFRIALWGAAAYAALSLASVPGECGDWLSGPWG
ncbi:MAG TPA: hypothetical protein VGY58_02865 [Gemmataceae bacterium]|jgi:hypothetical protein|nr:hypothetical protein [Gemmataceae bacterium]